MEQWHLQLQKSYTEKRGQVTDWPKGRYRTIYLDPPWPFLDRISPTSRGASHYYPSLSIKEIKDLPILSISQEDCLIWMWIPRLFRRYGEEIIEAWGFIPRTEWVWVKTTSDGKIRGGMGHYNRMAHEYLMLGTRGKGKPLNSRREVSVILAPRRKHSEKPQVFYDLIERNSLPPRIELFARNRREGWDAWGNEVST